MIEGKLFYKKEGPPLFFLSADAHARIYAAYSYQTPDRAM